MPAPDITFTVFSDDPFTYTVTASGTAGTYDFSGTLTDDDRSRYGLPGWRH